MLDTTEIQQLKEFPITPAKGEPMPQTLPYWHKRAMMDQDLILEQKEEIDAKNTQIAQQAEKIKRLGYRLEQARANLKDNW